ncbi:MAG: energy-coupling factor ABC transporter permease [Nocardioides sp.]
MHVPDGFLDAPTSLGTGLVAAGGLALALRGARHELDDRAAPMAGLVAAFVFAGQMMNFPVGAGTSGHLLGGALAAVLVGPTTAVLCVSVVLVVQSLLMADGGVTALGTNVTLMGLLGVLAGWVAYRVALAVLPKNLASVPAAAAIAAAVSVPVVAAGFTALYAVGGTAPVDLAKVAVAMVGWHAFIGLGEALITGLVVASVVGVRPDLVYGARRIATRPQLLVTNRSSR